jgi:hypothetical protein
MKEVFKCRDWRIMRWVEEWTKAQAWGCPRTPRNIQEVQASKLETLDLTCWSPQQRRRHEAGAVNPRPKPRSLVDDRDAVEAIPVRVSTSGGDGGASPTSSVLLVARPELNAVPPSRESDAQAPWRNRRRSSSLASTVLQTCSWICSYDQYRYVLDAL